MTESIRERLLARTRPSLAVSVRVEQDPAADAELAAARAESRQANLRERDDEIAEVQARVDAAQAAVDAGFVRFTVSAVAPAELEALVAAHPPTDEQQAQVKKRGAQALEWNPDTFPAAVLAACVDSDMSETDWTSFLRDGPIGAGEVSVLWRAALAVNDRAPDVHVGNGSRGLS